MSKRNDHDHPEYVTFPQLEKALEKQTEEITNVIREVIDHTNRRFDEQDVVLGEHSRILEEHSRILGEHTIILADHTKRHDNHEKRFDRTDSKLDGIIADLEEIYDQLKSIRRGMAHQSKNIDLLEKRVIRVEEFAKKLATKMGLPEPKF